MLQWVTVEDIDRPTVKILNCLPIEPKVGNHCDVGLEDRDVVNPIQIGILLLSA